MRQVLVEGPSPPASLRVSTACLPARLYCLRVSTACLGEESYHCMWQRYHCLCIHISSIHLAFLLLLSLLSAAPQVGVREIQPLY